MSPGEHHTGCTYALPPLARCVRRHAGVAGGRRGPPSPQRGFTLLELLATVAVLAIVLGLGIPALTGFFDGKRVTGAAEQVYSHLQQARLESIARSAPIFISFAIGGGTDWAYGVSHRDGCDPAELAPAGAGACVLVIDDGDGNLDPGDGSVDTGDLVLMRFDAAGHLGVSMAITGFPLGATQIRFDPIRGTATAGTIELTSGDGKRLDVRVGLLGQLRLCTPDGSIPNYSAC